MRHLLAVSLLCASLARADVPGIELVRQDARAGIERDCGVASLEQLPQYTIDQAIDDVSGTFSAKETVAWTNTTGAAVSELPLQVHANESKELGTPECSSTSVTEVTSTEGPKATFEQTRQSLVLVKLSPALGVGERVTLSVHYNGKLRVLTGNPNDAFAQAAQGMASMSSNAAADYGLVAMGDGIVTMATAYPMVAPFREGAFDSAAPCKIGDISYDSECCFRVRTIVAAGMKVITNLIDAAPKDGPDGKTSVVVSEGAVVREFLLVAGRDLDEEATTVDGVRIRSVYRTKDAKAGKRALAAAAGALASYEKRFGPYPYTQLNVTESSLVGGAGGVEFPAMVLVAGMLYRDPSKSNSEMAMLMKLLGSLQGGLDGLLDDDGGAKKKKAPVKDPTAGMLDAALEFTVDHEVGHQWFDIIVGSDCHRFACLDEPLAQYLAALAYEDAHGKDEAKQAMDTNVKLNYAIYRMMGGKDAPAARGVTQFHSTIEYAGIVYGKAPYLWVALRAKLGDARLDEAMREAVKRCRFKLVTIDDWEGAVADASGGSGADVHAAFRRWLREAHGDEDLGVSDDGEFVIEAMFGRDMAESMKESMGALGMSPKDLIKQMLGGGLGDSPNGDGIDADKALKQLEDLLNGK